MTKIDLKIEIWRGREEIARRTGKPFSTIRKWARKYHCPLRHDPGNSCYLIAYEYVTWLQKYDDYMTKPGRPRKGKE